MHNFGEWVARRRWLVLALAAMLIVPSVLGMAATRVNYDMLVYMPDSFDTVKGQNILMDDFGIGSFNLLVVEGMDDRDIARLERDIEAVEHVKSVLWYDSVADTSIPREALPDELYAKFNNGYATCMAVILDSGTSEEASLEATRQIRAIAGERCFVAGMSALLVDLRDMCEREEPVYVALAVLCAIAAMQLLLDSWLIPFVFVACIGIAIVYNMGTNFFLGDISYITKALAAVLQLAVTMDYSIFLWHSYHEHRALTVNREDAMAEAINETAVSVLGSSLTTIAGFLAFCAMSFTLGFNLGLVMAKGVLLGLVCAMTVLPALILALDKPLERTRHKPLLPEFKKTAAFIVRRGGVILIAFAVLAVPAYIGYKGTNDSVYYDMGSVMPEEIDYVVANTKLREKFDISSTYMVMASASLSDTDARHMLNEISDADGVTAALGMESVVGPMIPEEMLPEKLSALYKSDDWRLYLVNSRYHASSDEINAQLEYVERVVHSYDASAILVGEAPLTRDMIKVTSTDFQNVTILSIAAIFLIILLSQKSLSIPVILVAVIEFAIFVNFGVSWYAGQSLPFLGPICISTIQLGSTVDYAILLCSKYKQHRLAKAKKEAMTDALREALPSLITSACSFFAATIGVAIYSQIDIIRSMCEMLARGAAVSLISVVFALPGLLTLLDGAIRHTTLGMRGAGLIKE